MKKTTAVRNTIEYTTLARPITELMWKPTRCNRARARFVTRSPLPRWSSKAVSDISTMKPKKPTSIDHGNRGAVVDSGSTVKSAVNPLRNASPGPVKYRSDTRVARTTRSTELCTRRTSSGSVGSSFPVVLHEIAMRATSATRRMPVRTPGWRVNFEEPVAPAITRHRHLMIYISAVALLYAGQHCLGDNCRCVCGVFADRPPCLRWYRDKERTVVRLHPQRICAADELNPAP
jgi:hypothetical protein